MHTQHTKRTSFALLGAMAFSLAGLALSACQDDDPCDEGQVYKYAGCVPLPKATGGSTGSGGGSGDPEAGGGSGGAPTQAESQFGKACADATECGGDAPLCGAPQLPICTQILCLPGEMNEGACPADWMCISSGSNPSACVKF